MSEAVTCDTSVLVPALVSWHADHEASRDAISGRVSTVPAHVLLETYSVLTRLPAPHRVAPAAAGDVLAALRVKACSLPAGRHAALVADLAQAGVRGGAVYDALIGATAAHHGMTLLTRGVRARATYDDLRVSYRFV